MLPRCIALIALLAAAVLFAARPAGAQATPTDYDANDNGLIEIRNLDQLNAMRWDLDGDGDPDATSTAADYLLAFPDRETGAAGRMGCPSGNCAGYELMADLTFPPEISSPHNPWTPIANFATTLNGNGHTLTGANINITTAHDAAFIGNLTASSTVQDLGLINFNVTSTSPGGQSNGILAGSVASGAVITSVYADGGSLTVSANQSNGGGLVGNLGGILKASYSTASVNVTGTPSALHAGGLVGNINTGQIITSYAAGSVTSTAANATIGGLVGGGITLTPAPLLITESYCDTVATGQPDCVGIAPGVSIGSYTTAQLQSPTDYTDIYLNWNLDLDGDDSLDWPWNFGSSHDYPTLHTPAQRQAATPPPTDYDADDNGLIEVSTLAQLNAINWDPDGDGNPRVANPYGTAFGGRYTATSTRMGCPSGICQGYELKADLIFPADTSSLYTPWSGISTFNTTFDGNGHTLTNLNISSGGIAGMFQELGGSGVIRNVGIINPKVTSILLSIYTGALVGRINSGGRVDASYVQGGRITAAGDTGPSSGLGGLVGESATGTTIRSSYSSAEVTTTNTSTTGALNIGGLIGGLNGSLIDSYAYGPVIPESTTSGSHISGGLIGYIGAHGSVTNSYCDTEASGVPVCIASSRLLLPGKTTAELQSPTGYTDIYEYWNRDLDGDSNPDNPWDFGTATDYPTLRVFHHDSPPPGGPRQARPPQDTAYDPAADHPEIYVNDRHEMAATCKVQRWADGEAESSRISFDLGRYQGAVILHLAIWNGEYFMSYESQDIDMPPFEREGQSASVRVVTDPAQTRFLLDSVSPTTNLVLGYADCHTDDPGATDAADPAESAETSTPATPPAPKAYVNDQHEMTATCDVHYNADGEPESSLISFDLGTYQAPVILHLSRWNGEYYASYESLGIDVPPFERDGQSATVRVATNPAETRFLLDSVAPTTNLLLGYADCHTAN